MRKAEFQEENLSEDLDLSFSFFSVLFWRESSVMYYLCCRFFFLAGKQCYVLANSVFSSIYTCTCILLCISIFGIAKKAKNRVKLTKFKVLWRI